MRPKMDSIFPSHLEAEPPPTRLAPHSSGKTQIRRESLIDALDRVLACRLTVVHAGAGYGKTSLLTQWVERLRERSIKTAWLTLEEDENDAALCMQHIIAACVRAGCLEGEAAGRPDFFDRDMSARALMSTFLRYASLSSEPMVVLLDEYERAQSKSTSSILKTLIRGLPEHVHLIISSRTRPELEIENLRLRGELFELTTNDLRFSNSEVATFLSTVGIELDPMELHRLTDRTEGWPIALQMARLWLDGNGDKARMVSDFCGRTTDLARYLSEQILSTLPAEEQLFLMQAAIPDQINGALANAISDHHDGWIHLDNFHENNLLLFSIGSERQWYRFHTMFHDFLREQGKRYLGDLLPILHERAATWLVENGHVRQGITLGARSGNASFLADLIIQLGGWRLVMAGHITAAREAVAALPDSLVAQRLELLLAKSFLAIKDGDIDRARSYFLSAPVTNQTDKEALEHEIFGVIIDEYSDIPASRGNISVIENLLQRICDRDIVVRALLYDSLASRHYEMHDFKRCLGACEAALSYYQCIGSLYGEIFIRLTQAKTLIALGRLDEADAILSAAARDTEASFGDESNISAHIRVFRAELAAERAEWAEARTYLSQALPTVEKDEGWFELYASAFFTTATVAFTEGGADAALPILDRARTLASARNLDRLYILSDCEAANYLLVDGRQDEAQEYINRIKDYLAEKDHHPTPRLAHRIESCLARFETSIGARISARQRIADLPRTGAARLEIEISLLEAELALTSDGLARASELLGHALRQGMFAGFKAIYLAFLPILLPVAKSMLEDRMSDDRDRYRNQFLKDILRRHKSKRSTARSQSEPFTRAENEVIEWLIRGKSNKEIASYLRISPNTVKYRMKSIFIKCGLNKRRDVVKLLNDRAVYFKNTIFLF